MFNAGNMFKNKLGITFDTYKTSNYTDLGTMSRPLTPGERLIMQNSVDDVYNTFTSRVAEGRKMKQADVDSIGQGRVWSGVDAKRIGLVDELGGVEDAIKAAAALANLKEFRIKSLPEQEEPFQMLMSDLSSEAKTWYMENKLGVGYEYYKAANDLVKVQGIQARTLYGVKFN
jgi:protease-4